ncbi:MAG: cytidylate kinase family protein [Alphaproteobacteria bacterium]|nr:cytidylate kinase family protein [Alphaproteobacteria bacterium]
MKKSITITGSLGSGKSTVAKKLSSDLGLTYYSTGSAQRQIAAQMGITTLQLNHLADKDKSIDEKIDGVIKNMNNDGNAYIVDSRLAWHFMPASFKVKLIVEKTHAAQRIFNDNLRSSESKYKNVDEVIKAIEERRQSERERFLRVYQVDIENNSAFDLVVDTTNLSIDEVCQQIKNAYQKAI